MAKIVYTPPSYQEELEFYVPVPKIWPLWLLNPYNTKVSRCVILGSGLKKTSSFHFLSLRTLFPGICIRVNQPRYQDTHWPQRDLLRRNKQHSPLASCEWTGGSLPKLCRPGTPHGAEISFPAKPCPGCQFVSKTNGCCCFKQVSIGVVCV